MAFYIWDELRVEVPWNVRQSQVEYYHHIPYELMHIQPQCYYFFLPNISPKLIQ